MKSPRPHIILFGVLLILIAAVAVREWHLAPDGHLHIRFLAVGQGDSAVITTPSGRIIVIDGGPDWSTVEGLGRFLPFFRRRIDLLMLSHPNADHVVSFPEILKRYSVGVIVMTGVDHALPRYHQMFAIAGREGIPIILAFAGRTLDLGDSAMLTLLWPPEVMPPGFTKNVNDTSVVARLDYRGHRALFTGDIERPTEETLVRAHVDLRSDVLKIPHHGSRTSSSTGFLLAVHPSLAVISVGENTYGHPRMDIIKRIKDLGIEVKRTDQNGTVEVVW